MAKGHTDVLVRCKQIADLGILALIQPQAG